MPFGRHQFERIAQPPADGNMQHRQRTAGALRLWSGKPMQKHIARVSEESVSQPGVSRIANLVRLILDLKILGQHERQRKTMFPSLNEYTTLFGLNKTRLARTKPDSLIMHPGPVNRGVEIDSDIADSSRSLILEQVTNGIAVRMAVLFLVNGGIGPQEIGTG